MDSDSDWDSLTGDGPSILKTKSEVQRPQLIPPNKKISNQLYSSPAKTKSINSPQRKQEFITPSPPHQKKKETATVFVDRGGYEYQNKDEFPSVELEDKSHLQKKVSKQERGGKNKNTENDITTNKENLPYLKFQAAEHSLPHPKRKSKIQANGKPHQRQYEFHEENLSRKLKKQTNEKPSVKEYKSENVNIQLEESNETEDDFTDQILENNNIYDTSYTEESVVVENKQTNQSKEISSRDIILKDDFIEKRYYYEKAYYDFHSVEVEDNAIIPKFAEKLDRHIHRCWREIFGVLQIVLSIAIIFVLELITFIGRALLQKLVVGLLKVLSNYLLKPFLSNLFNSILQPLFIWLWNILSSVRQLLQPGVGLVMDFLQPVVTLLQAFRLVEYKRIERCTVKDV